MGIALGAGGGGILLILVAVLIQKNKKSAADKAYSSRDCENVYDVESNVQRRRPQRTERASRPRASAPSASALVPTVMAVPVRNGSSSRPLVMAQYV